MEDAMDATGERQMQTSGEAAAVRGVSNRGAARRLKRGVRRRSGDNDGGSVGGGRPNANVSGRRVGGTSSSIASLVTDPSTASEIPVHKIPALVAELASEQATLSALQGVLTARLLASQDNAPSAESTDHLLTAEQVARILG